MNGCSYVQLVVRHSKRNPLPPNSFVIRRIFAFIIIVSFSYITVEVAIADVHDGDAPASEVAKLAGNAPGAPLVPDGPADGPTHDMHVCHCAHPHGGLTASALVLAHFDGRAITRLSLDALAPETVDLDNHLRPPIA